jgi:hypothetical protein
MNYMSLKENYSSFGNSNNSSFVQGQQIQQPHYQPQQPQTFTSHLFDDPKSYLQKSSQNLDIINTANAINPKGDAYTKSPEYLQQKINDMKSKMQNYVGAKNLYSFGEKSKNDE